MTKINACAGLSIAIINTDGTVPIKAPTTGIKEVIAIKTLTPEEQQLIYHYYIQEKSLLVLATQKGITKQAYSYRHRKILEKLRQVLEPNIQG